MSGRFKKAYWPELSTATEAERAVKGAAYVAFFVAALTGLVSLLSLLSVTQILSGWAILDALLFGVLGFFMLRGSRAAAVLGLILYVIELVAAIAATGNPAGLIVGLFFTSAFISGVRGAYVLKRLKDGADNGAPAAHTGSRPA
jgi:hypothetical protein